MIVAVVNDHTGEFIYILKGYEHRFPHVAKYADSITERNLFGEYLEVRVVHDGMAHFLNSLNYSFIYDETKGGELNEV